MRSRLQLSLTAGLLLAGCAAPLRYAALGPDQLDLVAEQCSRPNPPRYESIWAPSPEQLQQAEQDLGQLDTLAPADCCGAVRVGDPKAYQRQYYGIIVKGQRLIYVNAFLDTIPNKEWRQYAIVICGGGTAAWGALYDPAARQFSEFAFNGGK
jgi:hypothetical protein